MDEFMNTLLTMAYDEMEDVKKYIGLYDKASFRNKGVLKDIAHDEYTHAHNLVEILKEHDVAPLELMERWNALKKEYAHV